MGKGGLNEERVSEREREQGSLCVCVCVQSAAWLVCPFTPVRVPKNVWQLAGRLHQLLSGHVTIVVSGPAVLSELV